MDEFEPLAADLAKELLRWPAGERIRRLRVLRGKSQKQVLEELKARGLARSAGWLSSLESGSIALKGDVAAHMSGILQLSLQDTDLLSDGAGAVGDDLIRYNAWQSVRLFLAETYSHKLDGIIRTEAQAAQRALRTAITDPTGPASHLRIPEWDIQTLKVSVDRHVVNKPGSPIARALSPHVRWMLLIEGLYMDPYQPFRPGVWSKGAPDATLEALADALALDWERERDLWQMLLGIRRRKLGNPTEPAEPPRAQPGIPAQSAVLYGETALDVFAGGAQVGEFGWAFAAGQHLLDVDSVLTTLPPKWTPAAMRRQRAAGADPNEPNDDARIAHMIWATGIDQLKSDLAKLRSMSELANTFTEDPALTRFHKDNVTVALAQLLERGQVGQGTLTRWNINFFKELDKDLKLLKNYSP